MTDQTNTPTPHLARPSTVGEVGADRELIYQALRFYFWAAGQGISPDADQDAMEPDEAFWKYHERTCDEAWETVAERYRSTAQPPETINCDCGLRKYSPGDHHEFCPFKQSGVSSEHPDTHLFSEEP